MKKNKITAVILAVILVVAGCITPAKAKANEVPEEITYIQEIISAYLMANNLFIANVHLSPVYEVKNTETKMCFVLDEDSVIGYLNLFYSESELMSDFVTIDSEVLDNAFDTEAYFYLGCIQEGVVFDSDCGTIVLEGSDASDISQITREYKAETKYDAIGIAGSTRDMYYKLPLGIVPNDTVNGNGMCWAACVASYVNYFNGTSYTAQKVYNKCLTGSGKPLGNPEGTLEWIEFAFSKYSISVYSVNCGKLQAQIQSLLADKNPILCQVKNSKTAHAIVLVGLYQQGSTNIYMFMDPNLDNIKSVAVSSSVLTDPTQFRYTSSGVTYTQWYTSTYSY